MPALQVRDFPEELYERLKECAASQHRSVAQQTIIAVERMVAAHDGACERGRLELNSDGSIAGDRSCVDAASDCDGLWGAAGASRRFAFEPCILDFASEAVRANRMRKRRELKERIFSTRVELSLDFPDPASVLHEARNERDERISELMTGQRLELVPESMPGRMSGSSSFASGRNGQ